MQYSQVPLYIILVHDDNEHYIVLSERGLHGFGTCKFLFLKSRLHCRLGIAKIVFNMQVVEKKYISLRFVLMI